MKTWGFLIMLRPEFKLETENLGGANSVDLQIDKFLDSQNKYKMKLNLNQIKSEEKNKAALKSPRYLKSNDKEEVKATWKSYVQPNVSEGYGYFQVQTTQKEIPKVIRKPAPKKTPKVLPTPVEKGNEKLSKKQMRTSIISAGTNASTVKNEFAQRSSRACLTKRSSRNSEISMISNDFGNNFIESSLFKLDLEGKDATSLYHQQLKDEQRLYLLQKFMEHYEKIHHKKL